MPHLRCLCPLLYIKLFSDDMLKFGRQIERKIQQLLVKRLNISQCVNAPTKIVELPVGKVKGRHVKGVRGNEFYSFEGIPYGMPPVGELRFRPPKPAEPWKELDCLQERCVPVQLDRDTDIVYGCEDCLHLNVYTKHFDAAKGPLPVIVYIHGGGFRTGGACRYKYGPDYLMREQIVYVLFNYRLCALGFLSIDSPELGVHGNAGLHDTLLALRWVNKYISHFNGDPKNVTIMGTSAGSASVHFMMCLPQATGLFHRAIMMSGSMMSPWVQIPDTCSLFCRLAMAKGYRGDMVEADILNFLRSLPAEELVDHHLYDSRQRCFGHLYPFVPTLESKLDADHKQEGLLQQPYLQMMREAWSSQVPLLLGGTSFEGLVMYPYCKLNNGHMLDLIIQQPSLLLPYDLYQSLAMSERVKRTAMLLHFHLGPRSISKADVFQILDMFSYKLFWHGIHRVVLSRLAYAQAPTYMYRFDFDSSTSNLMRIRLCGNDIRKGVCHADELGYMFPRIIIGKPPLGKAENCTIDRMVGILTSFALTGDPNCPECENKNWMPVSSKDPFIAMNIGTKLKVLPIVEKDGLKVWNELYNNDKAILYGT
ncbi:hypothetical protein KR222_006857 [Zaprionus bogoriensis]|nr:hypothetical protein KR222_006857 [Zaprionus bogoriensis]